MTRQFLRRHLIVTTAFATCMATSAWAQSAPPADATSNIAPKPSQEVTSLDELVVTATRRAESVLDVPLSVTAISQQGLDKQGVRNIADLSRITPSITFTPSWAGSTNISIRGVSSTIGAGTTGIYLDDTPIQVRFVGAGTTSTNAYPAVFDLDRVEVLRGPQGTLFGAGSEGGTVRFITPQPSLNNFTAYGRGELAFTDGGAPSHELGVAIGGPIVADRVGFRFSASERRDGGWVDRVNPQSGAVKDKDSNSQNTVVLRGALKFQLNEHFSVSPSIYYQRAHRDDTSQYWANLSNPDDGRFFSGQPLSQPGTDRFALYSLGASYNFGSFDLLSNTSYFDRKNPSTADYTHYVGELLGVPYDLPAALGVLTPVDMINGQRAFTQEVRLQSTGKDRFRWVIGAFYKDSKQTALEFLHTPKLDTLTGALLGATTAQVFGVGLIQPGDLSYSGRDKARDKQIAGFAQVDFDLLTNLTVTAGVRVAKTEFSFANRQEGPLNGGTSAGGGGQTEHPVTPKVGINYKPTEDVLFYASAAKGFRSGGGNAPVPAARCAADLKALGLSQAPTAYQSDSVWSYEAGFKGQFFNRKLKVESSAFSIDWSNIQQSMVLTSCGFTYVANLGSAKSKGFDVQVQANPISGLTVSASVGYTDAKFSQPVLGAPTAGGVQNVITNKGDALAVAPWTVTLSGDYEFALPWKAAGDAQAYIHADYSYADNYRTGRPGQVLFDPYNANHAETNIVSTRVGVRRNDVDASMFVNNLFESTDKLQVLHDTAASLLVREQTFRPRTVGLTLTYRY